MQAKLRTLMPSVITTLSTATTIALSTLSPVMVQADIYEWEWINPADPSQGKQQSATLVPDGAGLVAGRYVVLSGYDLTNAYLIGSDLFGTKFLATNLTDADLSNANLQHADLTNAVLTGAVLNGTDIENTILSSTTDSGFTFTQLQSTYSYQVTRHMEYLELDNNDMSGWDFSQQYMRYATFRSAVLTGADFTNANLTAADMTGANLSGVTLTGTRLDRTTLTGVNFTGADIAGARFEQVTMTLDQIRSTASYQAGNLSGILLESMDMSGWDFSGQDMTGAIIIRSRLTGTDLSGANLSDTNLDYSDFENADLTGADLTGAWIGREVSFASTTDSGFTFEQFQSTDHYQHALYMQDIDLSQNNLSGWDFTGLEIVKLGLYQSNLTGADLTQAELRDADFREANLTNARLVDTYLSGANFTDANMTGAEIAGAIFDRTYGLSFQQISSTASYQTGDMNGITLSYHDMTGWDFSGKELKDAYLGYSTLTDAVFRNSNLSGTEFRGNPAVRADFRGADLSGAGLHGLDATDVDFRNADLTNARFYRTTLAGADLTGAIINGAYLIEATERGFTFAQLQSTASYQVGNLDGIGFSKNDLSGWDLSGQSLVGAAFADSTMTGIDLSGSDLTDASLKDLDLKNISLAGATLDNADIEGTSFESTTDSGFTFEQLQSTVNYQAGRLEGVDLSHNDLTGWNFYSMYMPGSSLEGSILVGANLNEAVLSGINIQGADLTDASIQGTRLSGATDYGLTYQMFSSTRSYQENDLERVWLGYNNLTGWRFAELDLYRAYFKNSILTDADFSGANLMRTDFENALLDGVDLTGADARGATDLNLADDAITRNFIHPDGHVEILSLGPNETMRLWDNLEYNPLPIYVNQEFTLDPTSTLRLIFEHGTWGSTITFEPGTPVTLGGTLELLVDPSFDPLMLIGRDLQLFDWDGVLILGMFDQIIGSLGPNMTWDTTQLYSQGIITALQVGDLNGDGFVGVDDLNIVLSNWNQAVTPGDLLAGDTNGDGFIGIDDLSIVLTNWNNGVVPPTVLANIPEPGTVAVLGLGLPAMLRRRA